MGVPASTAAVAAVASGLLPALRASDVRPEEAFRGRSQGAGVRRRPVGLIAQVVMSLVLLFVAGSFLRGLDQLQHTAPGFEVVGRLYAHTALPAASGDRDRRQQFYDQAVERLRAVPGVDRVALTSVLPLIPSGSECVSPTAAISLTTTASEVSDGYFATLGIPVMAGREFTAASLASQQESVIINESLARLAWPNDSAVGKPVELGCGPRRRAVVVGVARDTAVRRIGERARPHLYLQIMRQSGGSFTTIVLATSGEPSSLTRSVNDTLASMGQGLKVYEVLPLSVSVEQSYAAPRWLTRVLTACGVLALVLASVGLFGITAHRVSQRTQEIGVRMALGARRRDVFRQVLGEGLAIVIVGVALGELVSLGLTGVAASVLEGAAGTAGLSTHLAVAAIWLAVAACACYLPAAWASGVDPVVALRHD